MKKRRTIIFLLGILLGIFLIYAASNSIITLNSPDGIEYNYGDVIAFNCSIDTGSENVTYAEFLSTINGENYLEHLANRTKGFFNESTDEINISTTFLDEMDVTLNPIYIIDSDGDTCGSANDPCNLFNTSGGEVVGGFWRPETAGTRYFEMTFNDTYLIKRIYISQHGTYYSNFSLIEYSLDNENWDVLINETTTATIDINSLNIYARYLKFTSYGLPGVHLFQTYMNITGQRLIPSNFSGELTYNKTINFGGGDYFWNCRVFDSSGNTSSSSNKTFSVNATSIEYISPTPSNGTSQQNLNVTTNISSNYNFHTFYNINDSIISWFNFDDSSDRTGDYFENSPDLIAAGTGTNSYSNCTFLQGVTLTSGRYLYTSSFPNLSNEGFTLVFTANFSNASFSNFNLVHFASSSFGFSIRPTKGATNNNRFAFLFYNGTAYVGANSIYFDNAQYDMAESHRYAISFDNDSVTNKLYIDGDYVNLTTGSFTGNYFQSSNYASFYSHSTDFNVTLDEVLIINRTISESEGRILTSNDSQNTLNFTELGDYSFNVKPYVYDSMGVLDKLDTRYFIHLASPLVDYTYLYPNISVSGGETLYAYCRGTFEDNIYENISAIIQYNNGSGWTNLTSVWQTSSTYAVIGDSMSNSYGTNDWPGAFSSLTNLSEAEIPTYAVAGTPCTEVYTQLVNNVSNNTAYLFSTCGVVSFISVNNSYYWEQIYNFAKEKNISNIFMATMPPYDTINTYAQSTADTYCDKVHEENAWLRNFATKHDDLQVLDLWTMWHDTSGSNKTDCGWRTDVTLHYDGIHPNAAGARQWAEGYWGLLNSWKNQTYLATLIAPSFTINTSYDFRCFLNYGSRVSGISTMGTIIFTGSYPSITTDDDTTSSGSGTGTYKPSKSSLEKGFSANVVAGQKVKIIYGEDKTEEVAIKSVSEEKVVVSIGGKDYEIISSASEKIDLDNDGYYDLEISNNKVYSNGVASLEFKLINEEVLSDEQEEQQENISEIIESVEWYVYVIIGVVVLLIVVGIVLEKRK